MKRVWILSLALSVATVGTAHAQRFEGIITMHINSGRGRGGARGGAPDANGAEVRGDGRGARGDGRGTRGAGRGAAGRGADGRGGDARGGPPGMGGTRPQFAVPTDIEYMTRRGKVRISLGGVGAASPGAVIYVPDEGLVYTIFPAASMYMQSTIAELTPPAANAGDSVRATRRDMIARTPVVTHTKQFELIAGHRCEHITVQAGTDKTDICMAKGLGAFIMPGILGQNQAWQTATDAANGFPMKVQQADGTVMIEVTKVERKALSESLFSVPESYSKMPDPTRRPPGL
ncbi:MAG: DUF4412 domain-containing protein [Gemmatimonadota bacterium]|nr:DUF4412 domain-containing protein [Gemmatimonadota bacterium]